MSTTVSTLLQMTAATQGDKRAVSQAKNSEGDFHNHLQSATDSSRPHASKQDESGDSAAVSGDSSQHRESEREKVEVEAVRGNSEALEQDDREAVDAETDDVLELSETVVSYLTYTGEDPSSAVIEVSQEMGIVVTEAGLAASELLGESGSLSDSLDQLPSPANQELFLEQEIGATALQLEEEFGSEQIGKSSVSGPAAKTLAGTIAGEPSTAVLPSRISETEVANQRRVENLGTTDTSILSPESGKILAGSERNAEQFQDQSLQQEAPGNAVEEAQDALADEKLDANSQQTSSNTESLMDRIGESEQRFIQPEVTAESGEHQISSHQDSEFEVKVNSLQEKSTTENSGSTSSAALDSEPIPTADRARFVQRVSRAFQAVRPGTNEIQLKLSPPELGALRMTITVEQGVVSAKVETESAAARNILLDNLPALRERLAEQEIRVEKFDVDVGRDNQPNDPQGQFSSQDQGSESALNNAPRRSIQETTAADVAAEATQEQRQIVTDSELDVSI